jgi:hypothetical protein
MNPDALEALSVFGGGAVIAWAAAYAWGKWLKHRYDELRIERTTTADAERLARMETAIEALAVELERIGETQRYTLKLLGEHLPRALASGQPPKEARVITPH